MTPCALEDVRRCGASPRQGLGDLDLIFLFWQRGDLSWSWMSEPTMVFMFKAFYHINIVRKKKPADSSQMQASDGVSYADVDVPQVAYHSCVAVPYHMDLPHCSQVQAS